MHVCLMGHGCFLRFAAGAAYTKFLRHLNGLLLLGLTPFVTFHQKKIFLKVKTAGGVISEVREEK